MAAHKINGAEINRKVKLLTAKGVKHSEALRRVLDKEIGETQKQLDSVREQAKPPSPRDIDFTLLHETD